MVAYPLSLRRWVRFPRCLPERKVPHVAYPLSLRRWVRFQNILSVGFSCVGKAKAGSHPSCSRPGGRCYGRINFSINCRNPQRNSLGMRNTARSTLEVQAVFLMPMRTSRSSCLCLYHALIFRQYTSGIVAGWQMHRSKRFFVINGFDKF